MKDGSEILAKTLSETWNLPITSRTFSNASNVAKLKTIFKKDKITDLSYYRPISFSALISKILERVIYNQTNAFLNGKNLLYN